MSIAMWRIDSKIRNLNNNISASNNQIPTVNEGVALLNECLSLIDELIEEIGFNFVVNDRLFREEKLNLIRLSIESSLDSANVIGSAIESKVQSYRSEVNDLQYEKRKLQEKDDEDN